jgi:hypothetical protein
VLARLLKIPPVISTAVSDTPGHKWKFQTATFQSEV